MSGRWKKVVAITFTASPKKLPNINPQNVVEIPLYMNIFRVFFSPSSIWGHFLKQYRQPNTMISP